MKAHLKQKIVPTTWDVDRKVKTFITRPRPGGHSFEFSFSITTFLTEVVKAAHTKKEVKFMLQSKYVLVDGKPRYDHKHPVGLFDIVSIVPSDEHYLITLGADRKLTAVLITKTEAKTKIARVAGKTIVRGNKAQLNTNDGRCFLVEKGKYKIGDTIQFTIPEQEIKAQFPVQKGSVALLIKGRHRGKIGSIEEVDEHFVVIKDETGEAIKTKRAYAFVLGDKKPVVKVRA